MRIKLDAKVRTRDGQRAGSVKRAIFDTRRNEITAFVVGTGGLLGHDAIISLDALERGTSDGDEVVVDLTRDELNGLEHYNETAYVPPPYGWLAPAAYTLPSAAYLFPLEPGMPIPMPETTGPRPRRPAISEGMRVKDATGAVIGAVREVRVDDMTGELRSIVVRDDSPLAGDGPVTEIPADHIDIGDGEVHVIEQAGRRVAERDGA